MEGAAWLAVFRHRFSSDTRLDSSIIPARFFRCKIAFPLSTVCDLGTSITTDVCRSRSAIPQGLRADRGERGRLSASVK